MAHKIKCFVSFSATDGDERSIRFLIEHLEHGCGGKVQFIAYFNQKSGTDLSDFMREDLPNAEAVIALFTPDYKYKADEHIRSGVFTEHMHIVDRLEGKQSKPPMLFIPVFWKGASFENALPSYFVGRNLARDLKAFKAYGSSGESYLPDRVASQLKPTVELIVSELLARWDEADPEFARVKQRIEHTLLSASAAADEGDQNGEQLETLEINHAFFRKSERAPVSIEVFSKRFFVKTAAFRAIGLHHKMAFTGRKGSGKTTLLKVYKHQNAEKYFSPIDIEVNDWNLHYLLEDLTFRPAEGDLFYTAEESKIFDFVWPVFLSLCMVRSLCESKRIKPSEILQRYSKNFERSSGRYEALFQISIGVVRDFIGLCISRASSESEAEFKADLSRMVNVQACTEYLLGANYQKIISITKSDRGKRRFLFCLDRFDTELQKYRKDLKDRHFSDQERARRENREVFWIQGLVEMIDHLRSPDRFSLNQDFYKLIGPHVDFCVPLPKDRLYEVQQRRRDAIVGDIKEEINWQPYELLTMLRKRLQVVWRISDAEIDNSPATRAKQRYDQLLEKSGRKLPANVQIRLNGTSFATDLFLNVLRHSFFRPRDVLIYYARIVLRAEMSARRGQRVSSDAVAKCISEETFRIVEEEFVGEFSDTFKNIREVLNLFSASNQILTLDELISKMDGVRFEIYGEEDMVGFGRKIRFLYEIGFLGISALDSQLGGVSSDDYDFYFFNPRIAQNLEQTQVLKALKFAIHPVFIEFLSLQMNSPVPIMMLTWDKVEDMDNFE